MQLTWNMAQVTQRLFRQASDVAENVATQSKRLYEGAVKKLPEGSENTILISAGALTIALGAFFIGRSGQRKKALELPSIEDVVPKIDFTPIYRLARLWLIARLVK